MDKSIVESCTLIRYPCNKCYFQLGQELFWIKACWNRKSPKTNRPDL